MSIETLTNTIADEAGISHAVARRTLDALITTLTMDICAGELRISGLGTFHVQERKATTGRNPRTGESVNIPAKRVVKFKAGKALNEALNPPVALRRKRA
jgi:DNA-binding protein HU-beta